MASTQAQPRRPLYRQLMETVRRRIEKGVLKPGQLAPSESDLIAEFRVSSTTARRCLNELATAGLVHRLQGKGTFVAKPSALPACRHIGVIYHDLIDLTDTFSAAALRGVNESLAGDGAFEPALLNLRQVRRSDDHAAALASLVERQQLDAMLLLSPVPPAWLAGDMPIAAVNFSYDRSDIISVTCDHADAFDRLAARVTALGHQRVALLRGRFEHQLIDDVRMTPLPLDRMPASWTCVEHAYFDIDDLRQSVAHHLASRDRPTAFVCFGYDVAMAAASIARKHGYTIPDDLSIAFIGVPSPHTHFSGESVPIEAMTQHAVTQLLNQIEGRPTAPSPTFTGTTCKGGTLAACPS